uniref:Uncharacterized protein n=1 Tax=Skeletonema marinoi TaxID=267567 RepID=A0A7S2Q491_9STRA|mmetsp:Transcript_9348/g.15898  ORF Transcript_9348/g.15898 Transcript_9348/m.15898 type:complete len:633 (+) Transcript_9348:22-1920(+)
MEARSRRRNAPSSANGTNGHIGNGIYDVASGGGDSDNRSTARMERKAKRKHRVANARTRRRAGGGGRNNNTAAMCLISTVIFLLYFLVCLVFFSNLDSGDGEARGMRGLVKKTKEKLKKFRDKHRRGGAILAEEQEAIIDNSIKKNNNENNNSNANNVSNNNSNANNNVSKTTASGIPIGKWPVSIRDEEGMFEDVPHIGYAYMGKDVTMTVPRLWANDPVAIHQNKLMSRERALSIGTCVTPDPKTNSNMRGDKCPLSERTIFVAIASYRDWQCRDTVTSILSTAAHPERVRVGVVDQIVDGVDGSCDVPHVPCSDDPDQPICLYKNQIDVFQMDAELAVGPVFARHIGHRLYRGEYYAMQSDAHVTFTRGWDDDIISQMESTGDELAVLTTYLTDIVNSIDPMTGLSKRHTRPIMCNTEYEGGAQGKHLRHLSQPEGIPDIMGMPQLQPYFAAGFAFSRGHFVATVPYDMYQPMIFQGEEMSIGLRGFTVGYDYFAPERSVCFHSYAIGENSKARNKVPHFWEHAQAFKGTGIKAMKRLLGIVDMNPEVPRSEWDHSEEAKYGLGGARETSKFYDVIGIDVVKKTTQRHLCQFVHNKMHKQFMKSLRPDGMGIDYGQIDFKWVDPRPNDE